MRLDQRIHLGLTGGRNAVQILGEASRLRIHIVARLPEKRTHLIRSLFAEVSLEQHLHRHFTGLAPCSHY
jgi:hypothetical protein